jgi:hypothetical protein
MGVCGVGVRSMVLGGTHALLGRHHGMVGWVHGVLVWVHGECKGFHWGAGRVCKLLRGAWMLEGFLCAARIHGIHKY